ncbi:MAG: serine/threonine-protein kinase [Fimbriimonadales bacterium]|nr:serine/threonine-protein kinase [Fimbriimonadales bacterium]
MALETVLGHYRIIREIARSNDVVYEAVDTRINRRVAIKELLMPAGATDAVRQDRIARFKREARAAGSLTHPNIVTIFETEEENGRYFIVMEYLEGDNLRQKMDREGALPPEEAVRIATQVLDGLAHAHSKGVIHRDIKPENIHILPTGLVKITDFGIARLKHEPNLTMDGQIFGTPSYMSPEQVQGGAIDERSDLFSVGVILFEMLVGYKPFQGDSVITITYNIVHTEPHSPPSIPGPLEWVIRKALRKTPAERFSTAEEMKGALQNALEQLKAPPVIATPLGVPPYSMPAPTGGYSPPYPQPTQIPAPSYPYPAPGMPAPFPAPSPTTSAPAPYLPPPPPKPILSPATRQFLGTLLGVMLIGGAILGVVILGVFIVTRAYEEFQLQQIDEKIATRAKQAETLFAQGRYLDAAQIYDELYRSAQSSKWKEEFRRNTASALTMYGNQLLEARRYEEAMQAYQRAIQYTPLPEAYAGMAAIEQQLGNREGAVNHWMSAAQHSPSARAQEYQRNAARAQIAIGDDAYRRGDLQRALQAWQTAVELAPGSLEAKEAQRKFEQALQELLKR